MNLTYNIAHSDFFQEQILPSSLSAPNSLLSGQDDSFPQHFPTRATSEPPPDTMPAVPESSFTSPGPSPSPTPPIVHSHQKQRHLQEYSWEWGAFPTPSPQNAFFPSAKGKEKIQAIDDFDAAEEDAEADNENDDSGGKSWKRRGRKSQNKHKLEGDPLVLSSGRIRADETDPTKYILEMEGYEVGFELSVVGNGDDFSHFHELDTLKAARIFDQAQVPFQSFLNDESIVRDEMLIIRWAGSR